MRTIHSNSLSLVQRQVKTFAVHAFTPAQGLALLTEQGRDAKNFRARAVAQGDQVLSYELN